MSNTAALWAYLMIALSCVCVCVDKYLFCIDLHDVVFRIKHVLRAQKAFSFAQSPFSEMSASVTKDAQLDRNDNLTAYPYPLLRLCVYVSTIGQRMAGDGILFVD